MTSYINAVIIICFPVFCVWFAYARHRTDRADAKRDAEFWEREKRANFVRRKSLDGLRYITIPDEILTLKPEICTDEKAAADIDACIKKLNELSAYKIVNLTGYTNTDLKLEYGTANITELSDFDLRYTQLATTLQRLAELLHANNDNTLATQVLEFAVSTCTDVSRTYYLLADLYDAAGTPEKINGLITSAQGINSTRKETIVQRLEERASL